MFIEKVARQPELLRRPYFTFKNARSAFSAFLKVAIQASEETVLLPAYVGWSEREGSGVFDPITELGLNYAFYRVSDRLCIDLDHLEQLLQTYPIKVLVLIHYFGHVDDNYSKAIDLAHRYGALVLEDEAHAMLTDLVGGKSGRLGDACIFSLHKILPLKEGGMLLINPDRESLHQQIKTPEINLTLPWDYDLYEISHLRSRNAETLRQLLEPLHTEIEPLWTQTSPGEILQTYPVLVRNISRDQLYFAMNKAGFGVVSLYHTMIQQITPTEFPVSHQLAHQILNFPIHQDANIDALSAMVKELIYQLGCLS
jgi:dTDP-4-amino-4,6-dideoxygalactose transaminase